MKIERIDHVAIAVLDLNKAIKFFSELLGTEFSKPRDIDPGGARQSIDPLGIELVESLNPDGPVAKLIKQRGEGLYVLSLKVDNLEEAIQVLQSRGIRLVQRIQAHPKRKAALFHPKDAFGVMIELIEYKPKHPIASLNLERDE